MKLMQKLSLLALLLAGLASTAQAALSVTGAGLATQTFAAYPTSPGNFSTVGLTGAAADYEAIAAFDAAVTNTASTAVATALGGVSATTVGTAALARYNTNLGCIQICPTGNAGTLLMATLLNNSVSNITGFTLRYDYILRTTAPAAAELVPGLRVFFSTSGLPGSWQLLPTLSALNVSTTNAAETLSGISWAPGANAYILWGDDNSVPNNDWGNTIDNLAITGVTGESLPTSITLTAPTNGFTTVPCGNATVTAATTGTITNVAFLLNGVLFTNDTTSPYGGTLQVPCNLTPGAYALSAVAMDASGSSVTSAPVNVTLIANQPPTLAITNAYCTNLVGASPGPNFLVGSMILVQAAYADDDAITNLEWQVDGVLALSNRVANTWFYLNALPGTHTLRGIATDRLGQQTISANYTITVTNPPSSTYTLLVTNGSEWRYLASVNGAQAEEIIPGLFVQWYDFNYSEVGWSSGFGELGDGDIANGYAERTLIDIGPATTKYSAVYFRKKFTVANPNAHPNLVLRLLRDDGAIVWLNGVSVWTNNMLTTTPDAIHPSTIANTNRAAASDDGVNYYVLNLLNLPANPILSPGENIVAVQVHNQNLTSSDLSFDFMLWGEADIVPRVNLTSPTNGQSIAQCSTTALTATASPYVTNVSFYANGVLLGSDATAPYTSSYTNAGLAPVQITAVGMDSFGVMATSAPVNLAISPNAVPTLAVTNVFSVTTGTVFLVGSSITNRYLATDDQAVAAIEFYLNGTLRYRDTAGFGQYVLNDAPAGNHTLTLVAFDNCGGSNTVSVALTVTNPPLALLVTNQSLWKYMDDGLTQDVSWVTLAFDDTGWSNGFAELGFGAVAEDNPPVTTLRRNAGVIATNSLVYYFRKVINVPDPSAYGNLVLGVLRDDGARVYLNGTEVFTTSGLGVTNFPPTAAAGDDGTVYYTTNVSPSLLVAGLNILAVEVRQNAVTSSDIAFDLMLWGEAGAGPVLHIVSDGLTHTVTWTDASGQYVLQRTTTVGNPASWADVPGNPASPYTQPAGATPQFYRLRKP